MNARDIIQGLLQAKLELQDAERLEVFWFIDANHVAATLGTKNGAVCAPILTYEIGDDDSVTISHGNESYRWKQLSLSREKLNVMSGGTWRTFSITRTPKKERWLP